mgnify:CR=1 FL=1
MIIQDWILIVIVALLLGMVIGRWSMRPVTRRSRPPDPEESNEIIVKRTRPSFRNPGRTTSTIYDRYKTGQGLYGAVKPGVGPTVEQVEKK